MMLSALLSLVLHPGASSAATLTVSKQFTYSGGAVTSDPPGINLTDSSSSSSFSFPNGTVVTLLASATRSGYDCCNYSTLCTSPVCTFTLNSDLQLYVWFNSNCGNPTLTVYKGAANSGNGTVTLQPGGLTAGLQDCCASTNYAAGTPVTLTAVPAPGYAFSNWVVAAHTVWTNPMTFPLNDSTTVQAAFVKLPVPPVVRFAATSLTNWTCQRYFLSATATAQQGAITNLQLFAGSTGGPLLLARTEHATTVRALLDWTTTVPGTNTLVACAMDDSGLQSVTPLSIVAVMPPAGRLVLGITNAECALCLSNLAGLTYGVLASTNLNVWTVIGTMQGTNGYSTYLDPSFPVLPWRAYRARAQTDLGLASAGVDTNFTAGVANIASLTFSNGPCSGVSLNTGPFSVGFYTSPDSSFINATLLQEQLVSPGCPANSLLATNWPITLTTRGQYCVGFVIDDQNQVPNCDSKGGILWYWTVKVQ